MEVGRSYHLVAAEAAMLLVVMAHWTEIPSQVPNHLGIMGAIALIISLVQAKANTIISTLQPNRVLLTRALTISLTTILVRLTPKLAAYQLMPQSLHLASTLATISFRLSLTT